MRSRMNINVVGCHAEGEIGDVIIGGVLPPAGSTMMDRMIAMERDHDHIRQLLICEPQPFPVVACPPSAQLFGRFHKGHEPVLVQAFRLEPTVESFDESILRRLSAEWEV